jgi:hypothetical protein
VAGKLEARGKFGLRIQKVNRWNYWMKNLKIKRWNEWLKNSKLKQASLVEEYWAPPPLFALKL